MRDEHVQEIRKPYLPHRGVLKLCQKPQPMDNSRF